MLCAGRAVIRPAMPSLPQAGCLEGEPVAHRAAAAELRAARAQEGAEGALAPRRWLEEAGARACFLQK